jgi:hypothetical protein
MASALEVQARLSPVIAGFAPQRPLSGAAQSSAALDAVASEVCAVFSTLCRIMTGWQMLAVRGSREPTQAGAKAATTTRALAAAAASRLPLQNQLDSC